MRGMSIVWRNLGLDAILMAVLLLLYKGLDPFTDRSPVARVVRLVLATALLIGVLPGSYLHTVLRRLSPRVEAAPKWVVLAAGIAFPLLGLFLSAQMAYDFAVILEETPGLVFSIALSALQAVVLVLNLIVAKSTLAKEVK